MKRQLRPYTVEIKSPRLRSSPGSLASGSALQGFDPFPADLPVRDVHEDLVAGTRDESSAKSGALREAERAVAGLTRRSTQAPPPALTDARPRAPVGAARPGSPTPNAPALLRELRAPGAQARPPRVLPDLSQEARQTEPPSPAEPTRPARVKRSSSHPGQPRARRPRKEHAAEVAGSLSSAAAPQGLPSPASPPSLPLLLAPGVVASLTRAGAPKQPRRLWSRELPRGERWKTRRLPQVCWAKPGTRRSS
jgi:hypothetical protein